MANKRMFSMDIVASDAFLDMPATSRELYFQLCMYADDEGFVNPKRILRITGASTDDLSVLIGKRFCLAFKSGVVVIKHWLIHNTLRHDRFYPTQYEEERKSLKIKENKGYTEMATTRQPDGNQMATQYSKDIDIEENRIEEREDTPAQENKDFFAKDSNTAKDVINDLVSKGIPEEIAKREINKFIAYWTELNKSGKKQRWELEKVFQLNRRLATWFSRSNDLKNFNDPKGVRL